MPAAALIDADLCRRWDARYRARWLRRLGRALLWTLASGGWLYWRAWRLCRDVAAQAPRHGSAELILVPGFRLQRDTLPDCYLQRLRRAYRLLGSNTPQLLLSGTAARSGAWSEALAGHAQLCEWGLRPEQPVLLDHRARDSEENLQALAMHAQPGQRLLIVSNRWHLARCAWLAQRQGLRVGLCAAEPRWRPRGWQQLALLREALALLAYAGPSLARLQPAALLESPAR